MKSVWEPGRPQSHDLTAKSVGVGTRQGHIHRSRNEGVGTRQGHNHHTLHCHNEGEDLGNVTFLAGSTMPHTNTNVSQPPNGP